MARVVRGWGWCVGGPTVRRAGGGGTLPWVTSPARESGQRRRIPGYSRSRSTRGAAAIPSQSGPRGHRTWGDATTHSLYKAVTELRKKVSLLVFCSVF